MGEVKLWRVAALLMVPITLVLLQKQCFEYIGGYPYYRGHTFRDDVDRAVWGARAGNLGTSWLDSVARAAPRERQDDQVSLIQVGAASAERAGEIRAELAAEVASLSVRDSSARITVVVVLRGRRTVIGTASVLPEWKPCVHRGSLNGSGQYGAAFRLPELLGQCALVLMHGEPGPAIQGWVRSARGIGPRALFETSTVGLDSSGRVVLDLEEARNQRWNELSPEDLLFFGCRRGDRASCNRILTLAGYAQRRGDFIWWLATNRSTQFRQFWRAAGNYDEAAQAAFGEPLTALLSRFLQERVVVTGNGTTIPAQAALVLPAILIVSVGAALLTGRGRHVA